MTVRLVIITTGSTTFLFRNSFPLLAFLLRVDGFGFFLTGSFPLVSKEGEVSRAKEKLGWTPTTTLEELVAEMVAADRDDAQKEAYLKRKGFAVVANEIKELANQSGQAAEDIARRIEGSQTNTEEAVKVIDEISDIIIRMDDVQKWRFSDG